MKKESWLAIFFAIVACSWVPHWTCHYYRLETESSFIVGSWIFSVTDSVIAMIFYGVLISLNVFSVAYQRLRFISALLSGVLHLTLAIVHMTRVLNPFHFEVFGYEWSIGSSVREIIMALAFGIACMVIAFKFCRIKPG